MSLKKLQPEKIIAEGGRVFERETNAQNTARTKTFAVCLKTDDEKLLIPLKIYEVKTAANGFVGVVDEAGEKSVYPSNFFLPLEITPDAAKLLEEISKKEQKTILAA